MGKIIAIATPVFFALIALEYLRRPRARPQQLPAQRRGEQPEPRRHEPGGRALHQAAGVGIYAAVYSAPRCLAAAGGPVVGVGCSRSCPTTSATTGTTALGHESAVFWAAHVVHHQSQEYNLSTALRQTSSGALLGWIFYLPMAIAGIPPEVFVVAAVVNLLYQYWIHTEQVGSLGWFDRWFGSPSNHRVHHAVNDRYIDRNYGGITMLWDRLFGTFVEESESCVYGTRAPLDSWDPLWANLEVYADLARKSRAAAPLARQAGRVAHAAGLAAGTRGWPAPGTSPRST